VNCSVKTSIDSETDASAVIDYDPFVEDAMLFAWEVHRTQVRKYTGEPYWL